MMNDMDRLRYEVRMLDDRLTARIGRLSDEVRRIDERLTKHLDSHLNWIAITAPILAGLAVVALFLLLTWIARLG